MTHPDILTALARERTARPPGGGGSRPPGQAGASGPAGGHPRCPRLRAALARGPTAARHPIRLPNLK